MRKNHIWFHWLVQLELQGPADGSSPN